MQLLLSELYLLKIRPVFSAGVHSATANL